MGRKAKTCQRLQRWEGDNSNNLKQVQKNIASLKGKGGQRLITKCARIRAQGDHFKFRIISGFLDKRKGVRELRSGSQRKWPRRGKPNRST